MRQLCSRATLAGVLLMAMTVAWTLPAQAAQLTVSAEYRGGVDFTHRSSAPAFCARWSGQCAAGSALDVPLSYELEVRDGYTIKAPAKRQVTITHERSGESFTLGFEVLALGLRVEADAGVPVPGTVQGGCAVAGAQSAGAMTHLLWRINAPAQPGTCVSPLPDSGDTTRLRVGELGLAYRLTTPPPLKMPPGNYHGQMVLSVGTGADFDLGGGVSALSSDSLAITFELEVAHDFRLEFAQGSDQVVLQPPGGWEQWPDRLPQRLYRDVPLRIWSSGPFTVHLRCQYSEGQRCGIRNRSNQHQVPVLVALTLPNGFLHSGQGVNRLAIPVHEPDALKLESLQPMLNQGGVLHFDVGRSHVAEMGRHAGMEYTGDVTVIFDAGM